MEDRELIFKAGALASTGIMNLVVNSKPLTLEIFAGPAGVMVELFQIDSTVMASVS
jgi:hypothetical protein